MSFFLKKVRLLIFLTGRIPKFGLTQVLRGLRDREVSYLAMELAGTLPASVSTIVDVGAHRGVVADALDFLFGPARIWVVEPNPANEPFLRARIRSRPQFVIVRACVGEAPGKARLNVYEFDAASSLFECRPGHLAAMGFSERNAPIEVPMTTLSMLLPVDLPVLDLLKLDCQGSELAVLKGAGARIRDIRWIYCEVSFDTIYEGAPQFGELHAFLMGTGFELRNLGGFSGAGPSVQWADALYANTRLTSA